MKSQRRKVLFVSENVTLAQVVRLKVLASALDPAEFEVHFASSEFSSVVFGDGDFVQHELFTIDKQRVFKALAAGHRIYEKKMLLRYVQAELELFERVRPELVVGDFRLSLSTSARLAGIPHATLINAYWSPFAERRPFPVPDHPVIRWLGEATTEKYFPKALPQVFAHFAAPVNAVRRKHRLPEIGSLLEVLTEGDYTLYADTPQLVPLVEPAPTHRFLGPVIWSPDLALDRSIVERDRARPLVYVPLGSSGTLDVLPAVLGALSRLPVDGVLSTLDRVKPMDLPANVSMHSLVPGDQMARHAALVICNGGSSTCYQALAEGTPVIGLPSNLDQYLAMTRLVETGAALLLKARATSAQEIAGAVERILSGDGYRQAAARVQQNFARHDARAAFRRFVAAALAGRRAA